jgi:hypothetical protein
MQLLTADRPLAASAGTHIVQLSITDTGLYRIETLSGGSVAAPVADLTRSFDDEQLARSIATVITVALREPGSTVADAKAAVVAFFDDLIGRLAQHKGIEVAEAVAEFQAVRAGFTSGLAAIAPTGHRQVRMTMGGAQNADLSDAQQDAIAVAKSNGGTVLRSGDNPLPVLRALARKRLVVLNYRPGTRRPDPISATLTARGWAVDA